MSVKREAGKCHWCHLAAKWKSTTESKRYKTPEAAAAADEIGEERRVEGGGGGRGD